MKKSRGDKKILIETLSHLHGAILCFVYTFYDKAFWISGLFWLDGNAAGSFRAAFHREF